MKKLCENGHLICYGNHENCPVCGGSIIYEANDAEQFIEVGKQNIKDDTTISLYVPDNICDFRNFRIFDNMIICDFIEVFRFYHLNKCMIDDLPKLMFEHKKEKETLRIEFCSKLFWKVMERLIIKINIKLDNPAIASDAVIMKELYNMLGDDLAE